MRVVADTNIIFSALLKKDSTELRILQFHAIEVYIPKFLMIELFKHKEKIVKISKLSEDDILASLHLIFNYCRIFNEEDIPDEIKKRAVEYVKNVDPKDAVFVASALTLDAMLWSGDKKLLKGLNAAGSHLIIQTRGIVERFGLETAGS